MKNIRVFSFVVKYFGFLKVIPLAPHLFDSMLRLWSLLTKVETLKWIDEIESEILSWSGTTVSLHKYGGLQFNVKGEEFGHLHSNGLMDVLYSKKQKQQLMEEGRISAHHLFSQTGWISFLIKSESDMKYAINLLRTSYYNKMNISSKIA